MREVQDKEQLDPTEERPNPKMIMSVKEASRLLGIEDFWVEELLLIGDLESLSFEDVEHYMMNAPTQEMEKEVG